MSSLIPLAALGFGIIVLVKTSDWFVDSAIKVARRFNVKEFIIGLTLVAFGTSLPEMIASVVAAVRGAPHIATGNVIGSNIANIGMVLGTVALAAAVPMNKKLFGRESIIVVIVSVILALMAWLGGITRTTAITLMLAYLLYIWLIIKAHQQEKQEFQEAEHVIEKNVEYDWMDLVVLVASGLGLYLGAEITVSAAQESAKIAGLSELFIGSIIIAVGTSLPELSVSLAALKKQKGDIILGNILGSNIANTLLILGVAGTVTTLPMGRNTLLMMPAMLGLSLIAVYFVFAKKEIGRKQGVFLLALYLLFIVQQTIT